MKPNLPAYRIDPLGMALLAAICVHALVILGVGFDFLRPPPATHPQTLEVTVVRKREVPPPVMDKADFVAESNQQGSGNSDKRHRLPSPTKPGQEPPTPAPPGPATEVLTPQPPARDSKAKIDARTRIRPREKQPRQERLVVHRRRKPEAEPLPEERNHEPRVTANQILASTEAEIARITRRIEKRATAYARRPRRRAISASTREFRYAAYLEAWRRKIERIGNLNYPEEARRKALYGNLVLHVAVRADGSVEQIRVVRSSGHKLLDEAAIRIVRLAAPFAPFPENIRKETDILDITRTWQFLRSNRLGWGK